MEGEPIETLLESIRRRVREIEPSAKVTGNDDYALVAHDVVVRARGQVWRLNSVTDSAETNRKVEGVLAALRAS